MKDFKLLVLIPFLFSNLVCYVEHDEGGLFYKFSEKNDVPKPRAAYEVREGTCQDSCVFNIQDMEQFIRLVVKNSHFKPVVLKIYSSENPDSEKVLPVFQAVADKLKNSVIFAGLNAVQNKEICMQIALFCKLKKFDFPLFLFYKDGYPVMPFLVGYQPQDFLYGYIQKIFFSDSEHSELEA